MSDQRVFARYKANEIVTDLQNFGVKKFKQIQQEGKML